MAVLTSFLDPIPEQNLFHVLFRFTRMKYKQKDAALGAQCLEPEQKSGPFVPYYPGNIPPKYSN